MVKLIDLRSETEDDVQFGTCELCMRTGSLTQQWLVFSDDNGKQLEIETGSWSFGDYDVIFEIGNIIDFADFIRGKEIPDLDTLEDCIYDLFYEYDEMIEALD